MLLHCSIFVIYAVDSQSLRRMWVGAFYNHYPRHRPSVPPKACAAVIDALIQ
jgi:hypothetical protein